MLYMCVKTVLIDSDQNHRAVENMSTGQQGRATEDLGYKNIYVTLCPNQV